MFGNLRPDSVWLYYHQGADAVAEKSQSIFQRTLSDEEYVKLIDARTGEIVRINSLSEPYPGVFIPMILIKLIRTIHINGKSHQVEVEYALSNEGSEPKLILLNFQVPKAAQRKGLGTQIFAAQVEAARAFGFDQILCTAVGGKVDQLQEKGHIVQLLLDSGASIREEADRNGYYTWPRLGFDKHLTSKEQDCLPSEFSNLINLSDLMEIPEGRTWWQENGFALELTFDTSSQSRSMRTLEAALLREREMGRFWESGPDMPIRIERGTSLRPRRDWQPRIWKYWQE